MVQYTLRNIPAEMDRRLRDTARRLRVSLNRTLLDVLARGAGLSEAAVHRDLDSFFGSWVADAEVDRALSEQRAVDPGLWK
ncbi:MAG: hypothetical protein HY077_19185 [Elusimicrobia bacterium]|nr:hypothetical protein [Elusimicrobiota bacterium]